VFVEDANTKRTLVWSKAGSAATVAAQWQTMSVPLTAWAGTSIRILVQANDGWPNTLMEALVDDIRVERAG
jgi:hypothetical protein